MWKEFLKSLVNGFACVDPLVYGYYLAAQREGRWAAAPTEQDEADEKELLLFIEALHTGPTIPLRGQVRRGADGDPARWRRDARTHP